MFALLAMAGDLGGSIGPAIVGRAADMFGGSIHVGMRIGLLFPITLCFMLFLFNIMNHNANKQHTERVYAKGQVDRIKKSILNLHTFLQSH